MADEPETVSARIAMNVAGSRLDVDLTVPTAPSRLTGVLPVLHVLADALIGAAVKSVEGQGRTVSCRKGCGACCRQMVPVPEAEAWQIRDLVDSLPEPRRSHVRARFDEARSRLGAAGLLDTLREVNALDVEGRRRLGLDYFRQQVACPFLEDESCSIHRDRPLVCREYLVTSPPELCAAPTENAIAGVPMPAQIWPLVARMGEDAAGPFRLVPLVLALEWADGRTDASDTRPTPEWVQEFFEKLSGRPIPAATPGMMAPHPAPE